EVAGEVTGTVGVGEGGEELRRPVRGDEVAGAVERAGGGAPLGLAAVQLRGEVGDDVRGERGGDLRLVRTASPVGEQPAGRHDPRSGVRDVVRSEEHTSEL